VRICPRVSRPGRPRFPPAATTSPLLTPRFKKNRHDRTIYRPRSNGRFREQPGTRYGRAIFREEVLRPNVRLVQSDSIGPADVGWDGRPLKGVIGLDAETEAIDDTSRIPRLALVSASDGDHPPPLSFSSQ